MKCDIPKELMIALLKITNLLIRNHKNRCEVNKLLEGIKIKGDIPLTNVRNGSIILVLFLTKQ